ncbi:MAG: amidohydrolase family protein, partial [Candidatus Hydrogenedentes bacterium]|nr:amidohydrolase family protein [Candidatus Hydrogenedentota bacterium]
DDTRLAPIVERAIELDVPIMAHAWLKATGGMTKESTSRHVANLGARYPELKLWMAHCGGRWEEAARVVSNVPNLAVDISGGEPEDGIVQCLRKHLGPERIFFGSDAPGRSIAVQMSKVLNAGLPEAEQKMILGENVRRWLRV